MRLRIGAPEIMSQSVTPWLVVDVMTRREPGTEGRVLVLAGGLEHHGLPGGLQVPEPDLPARPDGERPPVGADLDRGHRGRVGDRGRRDHGGGRPRRPCRPGRPGGGPRPSAGAVVSPRSIQSKPPPDPPLAGPDRPGLDLEPGRLEDAGGPGPRLGLGEPPGVFGRWPWRRRPRPRPSPRARPSRRSPRPGPPRAAPGATRPADSAATTASRARPARPGGRVSARRQGSGGGPRAIAPAE